MNNIERWIKDKPVGMALPSLGIASVAGPIYEYLRLFSSKEGMEKVDSLFPRPEFAEWIGVYENPSVLSRLLGILKTLSGLGGELGSLLERSIKPAEVHDASTQEVIMQSLSSLNDLDSSGKVEGPAAYWSNLAELSVDDVLGKSSGAGSSFLEEIAPFVKSPMIPFAVRVVMPCFVLYQRNPQELFHEARIGRVDSLAKLLIIDKEVLRDEVIFRLFTGVAQKKKKTDYNILTKALRQNPGDVFTLREIKVAIARFILDTSKFFGSPLKMPEIRALFDYIEKDRQADDSAIDEEGLYESQDSFYKAVMRHGGFETLFIPKSDK